MLRIWVYHGKECPLIASYPALEADFSIVDLLVRSCNDIIQAQLRTPTSKCLVSITRGQVARRRRSDIRGQLDERRTRNRLRHRWSIRIGIGIGIDIRLRRSGGEEGRLIILGGRLIARPHHHLMACGGHTGGGSSSSGRRATTLEMQ